MTAPTTLTAQNDVIPNPGNGFFRVGSTDRRIISGIQIIQPDPDVQISGIMLFRCGVANDVINLDAGERFVSIQGLTVVDIQIDGVDSDAVFFIMVA